MSQTIKSQRKLSLLLGGVEKADTRAKRARRQLVEQLVEEKLIDCLNPDLPELRKVLRGTQP